MARYTNHSIDQNTMVVINFHDHLQPGTFEHTLNQLFDSHIDLSYFDQIYSNDETGRPAYDPAIMLKVILFAYYKGVTSSREMEWSCANNITFVALACQVVPHLAGRTVQPLQPLSVVTATKSPACSSRFC
jgi:transposase